ncbi:hypothetical protein [Amycolatopsis magusensis]|uniref:hypothetical protein n=1 Tax=Amycolatopsis magusensis TaxID=882444 RepID=UPI003C2CC4C4
MAYRTTVLLPRGVAWGLRAVFAGCVLLSAALWWFAGDAPISCAVATVILLGVSGPLALSRGRIEVDDEHLRLKLVPLFTKIVPRHEIVAVEPAEVDPWRDFHGFGYRLTGAGRIGFVFRRGPAVRVSTRDGRTYVIGDPAADDLLEALRA